MIEKVESLLYITGSNATHKAAAAGRWGRLPSEVICVGVPEPNHLWDTAGLVEQKLNDFRGGWVQPDPEYLAGRKILTTADVNVGYRGIARGDWSESRKIELSDTVTDETLLLRLLAQSVARLGQKFGDPEVVVGTEAGTIFEKVGTNRRQKVVTVSQMQMIVPSCTLQDPELIGDYYWFSELGAKHLGMPWGFDSLSWLSFLVKEGKIQASELEERVMLPRELMNDKNNPSNHDMEFYYQMGRFQLEWLKYVPKEMAFAVLQITTNYTVAATSWAVNILENSQAQGGVRYYY